MTQRASVVFHPEKKGKKTQFYKRITRIVIIGVSINFLILLLYVFPFAKTQFNKFRNIPPKEKIKNSEVAANNLAENNVGQKPLLYAGHSFSNRDSADLRLSRDVHFAKFLKHMDPTTEDGFGLKDTMYEVQQGETLYDIAKKFNVSIANIKENNPDLKSNVMPPFLKIIIIKNEKQFGNTLGYYGIDVSSWQSNIDWEAVKTDSAPSPLKFYIIKATQGEDITDPYYAHNRENAGKTKAIIGAYHFYVADGDPVLQARNYISRVTLAKGDFRPIIDLEFDCSSCNSLSIPTDQFIHKLRIFLSYIKLHYDTQPILYTYDYFYQTYLKNNFDEYTYWMASYTEKAPVPMNVYAAPDTLVKPEIGMWQFSSTQKIHGIVGNVDISFLPAASLDQMLIK